MKTLSVIKKDLEFNRGLSALIEVLKNISVSQYRALEHKIKSFEVFLESIESFFGLIDSSRCIHPFLQPVNKSLAVVAVTSDSGLMGGLNMQVVNAAVEEIEKGSGQMIVIGERGKMYASEHKIPFVSFPGIKEEQRHEQAMQMRDYLAAKALRGTFGSLKVIYPHPVSFTVQKVATVSFLPFTIKDQGSAVTLHPSKIIHESKPDDSIEYLVHLWMGQKLFEIFGLSRLAEYAARYVHLEDSLQKLKTMDAKQKLEYFRVRHELIDRNMRELFSARLLYAH
jgi:ATP synthase F1 gamma subunit